MGETVVKPLKEFGKNSVRLVKRCTKPDRKGEPSVKRGRLMGRRLPKASLVAVVLLGCPSTCHQQWLSWPGDS